MNYLLSSCFLFFSALSLVWASPEPPKVRGLTLPEVSFQAEKKLPYLSHAYISGQPSNLEDGIEVTLLTEASSKHEILYGYAQSLSKKAIHEKSGRTDSFLVSKSGELLMECYYRRGRLNYPHYQMSITKSHTALALGRAIQLGYLKMEDLDKPVHQLIDGLKVEDFAKGSTTISLDDALKMCSGIRMPKYRILNAAKKGSMKINRNLLVPSLLIFVVGFLMGSFLEKSETKLNVIMAGVDEKGNSVCVNKSQVFLFKKLNGENRIIFHYHDALSKEAIVSKAFPDAETLETYWDQLVKNW